MSDGAGEDGDDASEELGETADKIGGIADRFSQSDETAETSETSEATETIEASETAETTSATGADSGGGGMRQTSAAAETSETSGATEATETTSLPGDDVVVREDWNGRTIYLSDDLVDEVEDAYGRYYGAFRTEHGRELAKNRDLYPAIFRSALRGTSIEEELGLVDEADDR